MNFVERLLTQLLACHGVTDDVMSRDTHDSTTISARNRTNIHIPSSTTKYRNKVTYGCCTRLAVPIGGKDDQTTTASSTQTQRHRMTTISNDTYSILVEDYINDICRRIIEFWQCHMDGIDDRTNDVVVLLREIMVKGTRSRKSIIIRLTIQYAVVDAVLGVPEGTESTINYDLSSSSRIWDISQQLKFRQFLEEHCPQHQHFCICYNVMTQNTNVRPSKDTNTLQFIPSLVSKHKLINSNHTYNCRDPTLTPESPLVPPDYTDDADDDTSTVESSTMKYVMEMTPNDIEYQISPDTFSEVNHPVELLQWYQTKEYIDEFYLQYFWDHHHHHHHHPSTSFERHALPTEPILIVSGRDISSFALGFGTLFVPPLPPPPPSSSQPPQPQTPSTAFQRNDPANIQLEEDSDTLKIRNDTPHQLQQYMFQHVIAIQHCPLVHYDAVQNIQRYQRRQQRQEQKQEDSIKVVRSPTFSVYHCSKATMVHSFQKELSQGSTKHTAVFGVMTGGRKGLDVSYVQFLNEHRSIQGIVYNSCATKSLLRDMTGFVLRGPYYFDHFRSYDFLPNTPYTASLTKLIRRPRTLIILIGPAGVGKSTMVKKLLQQYSSNGQPTENMINNKIAWWERDRIFTKLRNQGISLAKTKSFVHASLLKVLRRRCSDVDDENDNQQDDDTAVIVIDSTNGNAEGRQLYVKEAKPDVVIYVNFKIDENDDEKVMEYLLDCTKYRLNNNSDQHPSFPQSIEEQRIKHGNILSGMEYPTLQELEKIQRDNFPIVKRTVLLTCDPRDEKSRSQLPWNVFLEYTVSAELRQALHFEFSE